MIEVELEDEYLSETEALTHSEPEAGSGSLEGYTSRLTHFSKFVSLVRYCSYRIRKTLRFYHNLRKRLSVSEKTFRFIGFYAASYPFWTIFCSFLIVLTAVPGMFFLMP